MRINGYSSSRASNPSQLAPWVRKWQEKEVECLRLADKREERIKGASFVRVDAEN